jgi:hypothetical protein
MTSVIRRFRLADFSLMVAPQIDAAVLSILHHLESQIEIPAEPANSNSGSIVRRPQHDVQRNNGGGGGARRDRGRKVGADTRDIPDENWEAMRNFKATKIEVKTGIDKVINDIRGVINKISKVKLAQQQIQVIQLVRDYMESDSVTEENTNQLVNTVFDVASGNKMLAPLYAELYRELMDEFEYFKAPVDSLVNDMIAQPMIVYADPDTDYDGFCVYNKQIDRRKSATAFAVECMKADIVSDIQLIRLLNWYLDTSRGLVDTAGNEKIVEEFAEMTYIVVQQGSALLKESDGWAEICAKISGMSKLNAKMLPSCSSRAVFKYKDIVDLLNR